MLARKWLLLVTAVVTSLSCTGQEKQEQGGDSTSSMSFEERQRLNELISEAFVMETIPSTSYAIRWRDKTAGTGPYIKVGDSVTIQFSGYIELEGEPIERRDGNLSFVVGDREIGAGINFIVTKMGVGDIYEIILSAGASGSLAEFWKDLPDEVLIRMEIKLAASP